MTANFEDKNTKNLYTSMANYDPYGPKTGDYKEYEKLQFIQKNIEDYTDEAVDEYSVTVGALLKWLNMALDTRIEDVRTRRAKVE